MQLIKCNNSTILVFGILALYAYLIFINLNYAPFWVDEASTAFAARNIVDFGAAYAFDGRNIMNFFYASSDLNDDLTFKYPKIHYYTLATIFYIFGEGEIQARALSALFSLAAMIIFYDCLRLDFRNRRGFAILALCLTCFSPMVLLYSRSATYNAEALFFVILLYRLYLSYCIRPSIITACIMLVVAITGFHTHYLINASFVVSLAVVHCCFHMRGIERRTVILILLTIPYVLQIPWYGYVDPVTFKLPSDFPTPIAGAWYKIPVQQLTNYFEALNTNGILFWSFALYFLVWRCYRLFTNRQVSNNNNNSLTNSKVHVVGWREDKVLQYLVLVLIMTTCIALATPDPYGDSKTHIRFLSAIAPFATIIAADVIWHIWSKHKTVGFILGITILISNVAGYPFLNHVASGSSPRWTLPVLAVEFHREYPSSLRKALNYLQENISQDDLVCAGNLPVAEMIYYMTDQIYVCGILSRKGFIPNDLQIEGREYIFREDLAQGTIMPTWLVYFGKAPKLEIVLYAQSIYLLKKDFTVYRGGGPNRPEPTAHESFPSTKENSDDKIAIYHRTDIKDLTELKK